MVAKSKLIEAAKNPRTAAERILSHFVSNETAFRISDIGRTRDIEHYDLQINPFAIYWIAPSKITRHTGREYPFWEDGRDLIGKVENGEWDKRPPRKGDYSVQFEDRTYYKAAKMYFENDIDINNDEFWEERFQKDMGKIKNHVKRINNLISIIKNEGYLTQGELGNYPHDKLFRHFNEITVDIARDGEFLFVNSSHRLAAAKIVGLDKVPVTVCVRHKRWVKKLEHSPEHLPEDHPDVQNVSN